MRNKKLKDEFFRKENGKFSTGAFMLWVFVVSVMVIVVNNIAW